jgi:sialate O-acetylesterase
VLSTLVQQQVQQELSKMNFVIAVLLLIWSSASQAEVRLAPIFGDHMVLQRHQSIPVWGWADPGELVRLELNQQRSDAQADSQGRWRAVFAAEQAGGPYHLSVAASNTVVVNDVLIGEVWLAGGQSNMEWSVAQSRDAEAEIAQSNWPQIRHIKISKTLAFTPKDSTGAASWKVGAPEDVGQFSAAGYYFARKLHRELGVPIGIVNATWGGTNIETWISAQTLETQSDFNMRLMPADAASFEASYNARMWEVVSRWRQGTAAESSPLTNWQSLELDDSVWPKLRAPGYWEEQGLKDLDGVIWYRRTLELSTAQAASAATLHLGMVDDCDETFVNGMPVGKTCGWDMQRRYNLPAKMLRAGRNVIAVRVTDTGGGGGFHGQADAMQLHTANGRVALAGTWRAEVESVMRKGFPAPNDLPTLAFNAMIKPIAGFPVKGVIWYQGESNVPRAHQYAQTFPMLIADWRMQWGQPTLPFYFVQLASFLPLKDNSLRGSTWAELRDAQLQTLKVPRTGMVVSTDVGDANSIHPLNKQAIGQRLALHALKNEYGKSELVASGPLYRAMRVRVRQIEINFTEIGSGLIISSDSTQLLGFTIADQSGQFRPAQAQISGNSVIVHSPKIAHPKAVRYGWFDNPQEANLFNREGLPASPFRTDNWPLLTRGIKFQY